MKAPQPQVLDVGLKFRGRPQSRSRTDLIVLHHAAASRCTVQDVHQWHLDRGWLGIGYHFFIDKAGRSYRGRPEEATGAHCEGHNGHSIGICAEGDYSSEDMSASQMRSIAQLLAWLLGRHPGVSVKRHGDLCPTECPGQNYPFDRIVTEATGLAWDPAAEILRARETGLILSDHKPEDTVTWGELATVLNRMAK